MKGYKVMNSIKLVSLWSQFDLTATTCQEKYKHSETHLELLSSLFHWVRNFLSSTHSECYIDMPKDDSLFSRKNFK